MKVTKREKRENHAGSFRTLPNGKVEMTVSIGFDANGKHQRKRFYGKNKTACRKQYEEFLAGGEEAKQAAMSESPVSKELSLSSWMLDVYLPTYKDGNVEDSTYADYVYLANHVKEHKIGKMRLSQVKSIHVTEYFKDKLDLSQSFRKRSKFLLNAAFETAIDNDLCLKNPVRRAVIASKPEGEKIPFSQSNALTIEEFAKNDDLFGTAMYIMLHAGIRSQEMRALQVEKFDFKTGFVLIDRAVKKTGKLGLPKGNKIRIVPLEPEVAEFLEVALAGKSGYIVEKRGHYTTERGFRERYDGFFGRLNLCLKERGEKTVDLLPPHSTRHTFATYRQKGGMPVAILMAIMGHSSREMTDHYTHVDDMETLAEAIREYPFLKPRTQS
jgi:integrase